MNCHRTAIAGRGGENSEILNIVNTTIRNFSFFSHAVRFCQLFITRVSEYFHLFA